MIDGAHTPGQNLILEIAEGETRIALEQFLLAHDFTPEWSNSNPEIADIVPSFTGLSANIRPREDGCTLISVTLTKLVICRVKPEDPQAVAVTIPVQESEKETHYEL